MFIDNWCEITSDTWVLQTVTGFQMDLDTIPCQNFVPKPILFNSIENDKISSEIDSFVNKGIIEEVCTIEYGQFYSNVFIRPKKDGTVRVILNLKQFNEHVNKVHFKMETLKSAIANIQPGDYFASIDLKDAYFSVLVHPNYRKYLRFIWNGKHYQFRTLPQGLSCSPRAFTKLLKPVYASLRSMGHSIIPYIDDSLLKAQTIELCTENIHDTTRLMDKMGFTIHPNKSVLEPVQIIEFLGFILNSITMRVNVTPERIKLLNELCIEFLKRDKISIREFAMLIGKMVASEPGVQYAPLYYKDLEHEKDGFVKLHRGNYDAIISFSNKSAQLIRSWIPYSETAFKPIIREEPSVILYSDSSKTGWGGVNVTHDTSTNGLWSDDEKLDHINILELKAALLTIKSLASDLQNSHIRIFMDNTTGISYINKFGGKMFLLHQLAKEIWQWAKDRQLWISAAHIAGHDNCEADELSRNFNDDKEWMLNPIYFKSVRTVMGKIDIDLFASRINCQVPQYVSYMPDSQAVAIDAFTLTWNENSKMYYLFPPFSIISRCIQKIVMDKVDSAILVAPLWPTQVWFSELLKQICGQSYILPGHKTLVMPSDRTKVHPIQKLKLGVFLLSGKVSKVNSYQMRLSTSYYNRGDNQQLNNMGRISENGCHFVIGRKLISLEHLPQKY